jgi:hypothetical protein
MNINSYDNFFLYSYREINDCSEIILTHIAITDAITNGLADFVKKSAKKGKKLRSATVAVFILKMAGFAAVFTQFLSY